MHSALCRRGQSFQRRGRRRRHRRGDKDAVLQIGSRAHETRNEEGVAAAQRAPSEILDAVGVRIDRDHRSAVDLVVGVGLVVALVLELDGIGVEGKERLEGVVVDGELDDPPTGAVAPDVTVLEQEVEQRAGLDVRSKREGHDRHCGGSGFEYRRPPQPTRGSLRNG